MAISEAGGGLDPMWRAVSYVPLEADTRRGVPWATWFLSNGAEGEEPPAAIKERYALYQKVREARPARAGRS